MMAWTLHFMMMDAKKAQSGQALIELIIFLPLIFALYGMISGFAGAINGSINQQKITRAYYYFRIQNNSMVPFSSVPSSGGSGPKWQKFGMSFVGWAEQYFNEDNPVMPCYEVSIPLSAKPTDKCEEKYTEDQTQFIRVGTAYGICGATYTARGDGTYFQMPDMDGATLEGVLDEASCLITE
jgi:hypothetical protein